MNTFLQATGVVIIALLVALVTATWHFSRPKFDETLATDPATELEIASPDTAVTLARIQTDAGPRVVLVTGAAPDGLAVVDLQAAFGQAFPDAVTAFAELGYEALAQAAGNASSQRVSMADLSVPLDAVYPHIAAGTNYHAHAEEVGLEEGPFLFPKLAMPTPWNADVTHRGRLDYEVEVCAVPLSEHSREQPARLGYLLCNDFTDRWQLLWDIDLDAAMGTSGFPDAKGGDGMLPVGALLVIPAQADQFYKDLNLELFVNNALRQRTRAGLMVWSPREILARALDACDVSYARREGAVKLTRCAGIPAGTLILTGTPGGVMFHPLTLWSPGAYLQPGDEVISLNRRLGYLRNRIR